MTDYRYTVAERDARILQLHAEGCGRNAIARELGLSGSVVSRIVKANGLTFAPNGTETATRVRSANAQERRTTLAADLLEQIAGQLDALTRLDTPADDLAAERRARSLANLARATESTLRAIPPEPTDEHAEVRDLFASLHASINAAHQPTTPEE